MKNHLPVFKQPDSGEGLCPPPGMEWPAQNMVDFAIMNAGPVSRKFIAEGIATFQEAAQYIRALPYGRNKNKEELISLFTEGCGTCGTKHALLAQLAHENNFPHLKLTVGMFRMHARNAPPVADTLQRSGLSYLPEAHCYLRCKGHRLDYTFNNEGIPDFETELLEEISIQPGQIGASKVAYHKAFLEQWLRNHPELRLSPDELWAVREQCIMNLSAWR